MIDRSCRVVDDHALGHRNNITSTKAYDISDRPNWAHSRYGPIRRSHTVDVADRLFARGRHLQFLPLRGAEAVSSAARA